jgi:lysophospholipase L1-like esterase
MRVGLLVASVAAGVLVASGVSPALTLSRSAAMPAAVRVGSPLAGPPGSVAALGDSYNTGFDAGSAPGDDPALSWSVGDAPGVDSLYRRLLRLTPAIRGRHYLIARDGSKIGDLPRQMALAADDGADLVTVQSGGNDICAARSAGQLTPPASFRASLEAAFDVLRHRLPDARVLITSITDEGRWNDGSAAIPANRPRLSDGSLCDPLLDVHGRQSPTRRARIQALERRYNGILRDVCSDDPHCRYDGGAFFRLAYTPADVSPLDAFHPSVRGLSRLAATAWRVAFDLRDATAPHVHAQLAAAPGGLQVTLDARDDTALAGVEYRVAGVYVRYRGPFVLASGQSVVFRAVDRAGNISAAYSITAPAAA